MVAHVPWARHGSRFTIAFEDLEEKARARGYDGVIGVKISHPQVVDGGVEVIVYGNGYRKRA